MFPARCCFVIASRLAFSRVVAILFGTNEDKLDCFIRLAGRKAVFNKNIG